MSGLDGAVFDLDATLVDLGGHVSWSNAKKEVMESYLSFGCDEEHLNICANEGLFPLLNNMWSNLSQDSRDDAHRIQSHVYSILELYELRGVEKCKPLEGAIRALEWLRERNIPVGLCTSNSQTTAVAVLEKCQLEEYFSSIIGRTPGVKMKPHPEQLIKVFNELGVDPRRGVMIGDSPGDMIAGKRIGAYTIGIPSPFRLPEDLVEAGADVILESINNLPGVLEGLNLGSKTG
jgi:HAD superfamily hydrolase (TIGR01509 family)